MAGRTVSKFTRVYVDGYDMSGYSRSAPALQWGFSPSRWMAIDDDAMGALPGQASIGMGTYNGILDNTATSGMHAVLSSSDAVRDVMVPIGDRAAPVAGVPAWCAQVIQNSYQAQPSGGMVTVSIDLGDWDERGDTKSYPLPWGYLLHAKGAATAVNTSSGSHDNSSATTAGGYMMYQLFTGSTGTVTIKAQDSTGGAWADIPGLTKTVTNASTPASGIVTTTAATTQIDRYTRWQISLGTATSVTFASALVRGR